MLKQKPVPGSLFSRTTKKGNKYLYFEASWIDKPISFGLPDTTKNRKKIWKILELKYIDYLKEDYQDYEAPSIVEAFEEFIDYCINEKKLNKSTIASYKLAYNSIFIDYNFRIDQHQRRNAGKIYKVEEIISEFKSKSDLKATTINIRLRSMRAFLNYCNQQKYIEQIKIKLMQAEEKVVYTYSENEIAKILDYFKNIKVNLEIRDWVIFLLLTGSRGEESLFLKWQENIDFDDLYIKFPKKNNPNKYDLFPIHKNLYDLLIKLKDESKIRVLRKDYVFKWKTAGFMRRKVREALDYYGIKREGELIHTFRKTFISELINSNTLFAQKLARHEDIKTTQKHYWKSELDKLNKELVDKFKNYGIDSDS